MSSKRKKIWFTKWQRATGKAGLNLERLGFCLFIYCHFIKGSASLKSGQKLARSPLALGVSHSAILGTLTSQKYADWKRTFPLDPAFFPMWRAANITCRTLRLNLPYAPTDSHRLLFCKWPIRRDSWPFASNHLFCHSQIDNLTFEISNSIYLFLNTKFQH